MSSGACRPNGVSYAWIDPHGKVHETGSNHEEWAFRFVQSFPDLKREAELEGDASSVLLFRGWIRVGNFTAIQVWDKRTPPPAAWRAAVDIVRDCAIQTPSLDPFRPMVFLDKMDITEKSEVYSVADFIERFGGKQDSEAFFESMMGRVASRSISASGVCDRSDTSYAWVDPHGRVHETPRGHFEWAANYLNDASDDPIRQLLSDGWVRVVNYASIEVFSPRTPSLSAWETTVGLVASCAVSRRVDPFTDEVLVEFTDSQSDQVYTVADFIERFGGHRYSEAFFESMMARTAATVTVDKAHIDSLRRDVLMIARAADNVASLEDIDQVTRAVRAWRDRWDTFAFTLRQDLEGRIRRADRPYDPEYNANPPNKGDAEYYLNRALAPMWEFNTELGRNPRTDDALKDIHGNPWKPPEEAFEETVQFYLDRGYAATRDDAVREAQRYHDRRPLSTRDEAEAASVARWKAEAVKWTRRLRDKARKAWDTLNGYIAWLEDWRGGSRPLEIVHPDEEVVPIAGFRVVFRGFAESTYKDKLEAVRVGLERYRAGAAARAPIMLKLTPPIFVEWTFEPTTGGEAAGYYTHNRVNITPWVIGDNIDRFVKTLAHEVGHHMFKVYLSGDATTAWSRFIRGDYRDLDLRDALSVMGRVGASSVIDKSLMAEDPILHLQLSTLMYDSSYNRVTDWLFADGIRKYLDGGGNPVVRVPIHPITGYAGKNPEEAFCEAIGNLVAYGPKAVPDAVLGMLKSVIGGDVKIASRVAAAWLTRTASGVAGFHGWGMSPEAMRMDGPQFTDQKPIPPEDIEAAADYLEEVRPGLLVAYSRGGAVAMLAIRESGVRPKVIWVAPAWRRGWARVTPPSVSGVILHGDQDSAVPLQHSCELSERTGLPLHVVPGRNHISILKDKTNPSAGVRVPTDKVRECAKSMPDWGTSGKGSPDDIAKQEEFARTLTAARRKRPATGDCYEAAGRYIMEHSLMAPSGTGKSGLRLVHGEVAGQGSLGGVTFGHAWVLDGDTVIDQSNGRNLRMPKLIYYALGAIDQIDNIHVYTPEQARERMLRYEHFGPWDLKTRSGL